MWSDVFQKVIDSLLGRSGDEMPERRHVIRLRSRYKVTCVTGKRNLLAVVVDMSLGGMSIELPSSIPVGKELLVTMTQSKNQNFDVDTIKCDVKWCRKSRFLNHYTAGVKYADTDENMRGSWVKFVLGKELGFSETFYRQRRGKMRVQTDLPLKVRNNNEEYLTQGTTISLSLGGAMLKTEIPITNGKAIIAEIGPYSTSPLLRAPCVVLSSRKEVETQSYLHRVRFDGLDEAAKGVLNTYMRGLRRDNII